MAVVTIVMGSVLGFFAALICWLALDYTFVQAFGFYLIASLGCGALGTVTLIKLNTPDLDHI